MRRLGAIIAIAVIALGAFSVVPVAPAWAQETVDQPEVRVRLEPTGAVTVGQPVNLIVEVFVPSYFAGAPRFQELDLADALVIFNDRGTNLSERRGQQTWAGQSRSYTIYPQRAGRFEIPSIDVAVTYMAAAAGRTTVTASSGPVSFAATIPPEAEGLGYFIATSSLSLDEVLEPVQEPDPEEELEAGEDPEPGEELEPKAVDQDRLRTIRIGEALTRTVTVTVDDALSMVVPPLDLGAPEGLASYPDPPRVSDTSGERGAQIVGTRVESTTFVARDEGSYVLPALELAWWDVAIQQLQRATVPALRLEVVPNPDLMAEFVLPAEEEAGEVEATVGAKITLRAALRRWGTPLALLLLGLVLATAIARHFGITWSRIRSLWQRAEESEASYFRTFKRTARAGQPSEVARSFMFWLDRFHDETGPATYGELSEKARDGELDAQASALDAELFGRPDTNTSSRFVPAEFSRAVARARKMARSTRRRPRDEPVLPPLNPKTRRL